MCWNWYCMQVRAKWRAQHQRWQQPVSPTLVTTARCARWTDTSVRTVRAASLTYVGRGVGWEICLRWWCPLTATFACLHQATRTVTTSVAAATIACCSAVLTLAAFLVMTVSLVLAAFNVRTTCDLCYIGNVSILFDRFVFCMLLFLV